MNEKYKPHQQPNALTVAYGDGKSFALVADYNPYPTSELQRADTTLPDPDNGDRLTPVVHLYTAHISGADTTLLNRMYKAAQVHNASSRQNIVIIGSSSPDGKNIVDLTLGSRHLGTLSSFIAQQAEVSPHLLQQNMQSALTRAGIAHIARQAG